MNRLTSTEQKTQWTSAAISLDLCICMKPDLTNMVLTFLLGVLLVLGVVFDLRTINRTREFRSLNNRVAQTQTSLMQAQSLASDVAAYNQKNPSPELTRLLQSIQPKPAAH